MVYISAANKPFRSVNGRLLGGLGLFGGILYATMRSTQRLVGLEPNASEVARFGAMDKAELEERIAKEAIPNLNLIDETANQKDY